MLDRLYQYKFEVFLYSQVAILFGALIVPARLFETTISPILFYINLIAGGILLMSENRTLKRLVLVVIVIFGVIISFTIVEEIKLFIYMKIGVLFIFHLIVAFEIIKQIWQAKKVNRNVIYGLISGYISLGLIGFFICLSVELVRPGSFQGLLNFGDITSGLMYYSYITMLTIGFGDIVPITLVAQKATILIGLMGQFYLVIISAVVIGKYITKFKKD